MPPARRRRTPRNNAQPPSGGEGRVPRTPQQSRGLRRVEEILDAAEAVIAEVGVDAATTNAIAERAGSSVGSLYHFFPDKDSIVRELALRFSRLIGEVNAGALPAEAVGLPVDRLFERIVMSQAALMEQRPAFNAVYAASCRDALGKEAYEEMDRMIVGQVLDFMSVRLPRLPRKERETIARLSVTVVNHVLEDARLSPPDRRAALLRELQRMMVRYFEPMDSKYGPPPR